tara:strand:- start:552 stop:1433 length:882 start_codon:yes stop_codon:yes gene_type:complete
MKIDTGILLAGGTGSRMFPSTKIVNKHLMNIYDKPMIYHSLSILLLLKIKKIIIVVDDNTLEEAKKLIGNGSEFGVQIKYVLQDKPLGLPHAINNVQAMLEDVKKFLVVLGDNFLFGREFYSNFYNLIDITKSNIFFQKVNNPQDFGIIEMDEENKLVNIVEKPNKYISDLAVTGIYTFDESFFSYFKEIKKSNRDEYEITDILKLYLLNKKLNHVYLGRGMTWMDMGNYESLLNCSNFVRTIQERQNILVNSPHEISYRNGWIEKQDIENMYKQNKNSAYFIELYKNIDSNF